jgi:hypothetical protein
MNEIGSHGLLLALLIGLSGCDVTEAAERVALVIGNGQYDNAARLSNPERDAEAIARALKGLGFSVTGPLLNQSKTQMDTALRQFGRQAQSATAAVVYFSGHGLELGGQNYLIPKDAVLEREKDVSLEAVALNVVLDQVSGVNGYRLVILDACRDNPLANNMVRTNGAKAAYRGLAPVEPVGQTYVAYAARHGQRSQDGAAGGNSPYATALLKYLPQPGLALERLFGAVRDEVKRGTNGEQTPFLYGESGTDPIYLAGMRAVVPSPVVPAPVSSPPPTVDYDHEAWKSAEKCGTAACFRAYLKKYPRGQYAEMAQARLEPETQPESRPVVATTRPAPVAQPNQRFTDNDDGTVTDNKSGLIWLKNANCFGYKHWSTAMDLAKSLKNGQCDLRDRSVAGQWRLPSKEEWEILIDKSARNPALPAGHPFIGVLSNGYWSSTSGASSSSNAWSVNLDDTSVYWGYETYGGYVWPVRGGR